MLRRLAVCLFQEQVSGLRTSNYHIGPYLYLTNSVKPPSLGRGVAGRFVGTLRFLGRARVRYTALVYSLVKPLLFRADPETVHDLAMNALERTSRHPGALRLVRAACRVEDERLAVRRFGLRFPNPVGLAAGFDKNARAVPAWLALGFGSVEIGSVTALAQRGNDKPRLFRLPQDRAVINRMGFNNAGAAGVAARLAQLFQTYGKPDAPLGINLGKSKVTPLGDAPQDYETSLRLLWSYGDYFVVNVSSPNTPGLRELQDRDKLEALLDRLTRFVRAQREPKPLLLKIAPDLSGEGLDAVIDLAQSYGVGGLIATNTTVAREGLRTPLDEAGGLSGYPLRARSLEVLRHIRARTRLPVVSVGGVATADDVYERLEAGACLVQLYTSFVYEGPGLLRKLNRGLLERLERSGYGSVQELINKA